MNDPILDIFRQILAYYLNICPAIEQLVPIFAYGIWLLNFVMNCI